MNIRNSTTTVEGVSAEKHTEENRISVERMLESHNCPWLVCLHLHIAVILLIITSALIPSTTGWIK